MSDTTKRVVLLLGITTLAAGGYVAYSIYKKKKSEDNLIEVSEEETVEAPEEEDDAESPDKFIFGDDIARMPEPTEIEKTEYTTKASVYSEYEEDDYVDDFPHDDDEEDDYVDDFPHDDDEEDEEEELEAYESSKEYSNYRNKNKNKIIVLPEDNIGETWNRDIGNDPSNPEVIYEEEELYYFTVDDKLTDEDGNIIDEDQYLGPKPRQFGWFTNDKEDLFIRNNPLERDFRVNKVRAVRSDYF